jgi:hypothetical protein
MTVTCWLPPDFLLRTLLRAVDHAQVVNFYAINHMRLSTGLIRISKEHFGIEILKWPQKSCPLKP